MKIKKTKPKNKEKRSALQTKWTEGMLILDEVSKKCKLDYVSAFSAQSAFFILLSFFPFVLLLMTMTHYLPFTQADIVKLIMDVAPAELSSTIVSVVDSLYDRASVSVMSLSVILTLWSAAKGFMALRDGLNNIYEHVDYRNYFLMRFISALYTLVFMILLIIMMGIFVFGNRIYATVVNQFPTLQTLNNIAGLVISIRTIVGIVILFIFFILLYVFLPTRKGHFRQEIPGAVISTAGWLIISYGLSIYVDYAHNLSYMYGSLTSIILAMLWLYFLLYIVFLGAEVNCLLQKGYLTRIKKVLK